MVTLGGSRFDHQPAPDGICPGTTPIIGRNCGELRRRGHDCALLAQISLKCPCFILGSPAINLRLIADNQGLPRPLTTTSLRTTTRFQALLLRRALQRHVRDSRSGRAFIRMALPWQPVSV